MLHAAVANGIYRAAACEKTTSQPVHNFATLMMPHLELAFEELVSISMSMFW